MSAPTITRCTDHRHHGHHGSHAECYAAGLHAATKAGRERCRLGSRKIFAVETAPVMNLKSKVSNVIHLPNSSGEGTLCDVSIAAPEDVNPLDYIATCKRCLKLASA